MGKAAKYNCRIVTEEVYDQILVELKQTTLKYEDQFLSVGFFVPGYLIFFMSIFRLTGEGGRAGPEGGTFENKKRE